MKYRPDIDGLRAIAVLAVIGYHVYPDFLPGGYIGVDVFFVISGYLITSIIILSHIKHNFTYSEFYSRRIVRILPSLIVVLLSSFIVGYLFLLPDEFKKLSLHIMGGAGFVSNFILWSETGYFDIEAAYKPLLHLWSLGVEEQFYAVWPLVLFIVWRNRLATFLVLLLIAVLSFKINISNRLVDHIMIFYSPITRFWELSAGGLLATYEIFYVNDKNLSKSLKNMISLSGIILILISILLFNDKLIYPGWWAVIPTAGSYFLIYAGKHAWFNKMLLSRTPMVMIGLISYPLYLWHWPVLSLTRIIERHDISNFVRATCVGASFILAWSTYRYIEVPFRYKVKKKKLNAIFLLVLLVVIVNLGIYVYKMDGLPSRVVLFKTVGYNGDIGHKDFYKYLKNYPYCKPEHIFKSSLKSPINTTRCVQSIPFRTPDIAIIGDSHAESLFIGLAEYLPERNVVYYTRDSVPVLSDDKFTHIYKYVLYNNNIDVVILAGYWNVIISSVEAEEKFKFELSYTINKLIQAGKKVYLSEDVPDFSFDPKLCKYSHRKQANEECLEKREEIFDKRKRIKYIIDSLVIEHPDLRILYLKDYLCDSEFCHMEKEGNLLYRDRNHLNINGSKYIGKKIVDECSDILLR